MYLCNVLLQKGLPIVQQRAEGPDFFIRNDAKAYIECIAPTPGAANNPDTVPEPYSARLNESQRLQAVPEQQILLRITQAIKEKADKYDRKWQHKALV